jgi:hypothetical protein
MVRRSTILVSEPADLASIACPPFGRLTPPFHKSRVAVVKPMTAFVNPPAGRESSSVSGLGPGTIRFSVVARGCRPLS